MAMFLGFETILTEIKIFTNSTFKPHSNNWKGMTLITAVKNTKTKPISLLELISTQESVSKGITYKKGYNVYQDFKSVTR